MSDDAVIDSLLTRKLSLSEKGTAVDIPCVVKIPVKYVTTGTTRTVYMSAKDWRHAGRIMYNDDNFDPNYGNDFPPT